MAETFPGFAPSSPDAPGEDRFGLALSLPESASAEARRLCHEGDLAFSSDDLALACSRYRAAIAADPRGLRARHNLGVAAVRLERWDTALEAFSACADLAPDVADLHYKVGLALKHLDRHDEALLSLHRAVGCDADHLDARYQIALIEAQDAPPASAGRGRAIDALDSILSACERGVPFSDVDRVCFLLGSFLDDFPDQRDRAIAAYRRGLEVDPLFAPGHNNLGILLMQAGQTIPALGEFKIAIHLQPDYTLPYRNLAQLLFDRMTSAQMEQEFATITEEFGVQGPAVLARLSLQLIDLGRAQVFESLYTHGHRIKNLMGLSGNRLRRTSRRAGEGSDLSRDLSEIVSEQERIYEQWVTYLRAMKPDRLNLTLVDLPPLARRAAETVAAQRPEAALSFDSEERVPQIKADPVMLHEAVTNLVLNAFDAVAAGPHAGKDGRVAVQTGFDAGRTSAFIEIEDNGTGIPEDLQGRIFDPGFSTRERGNGYGLPICSRIVAAHRGSIRVVSRPGHGAVFRIDLPVDFEVSTSDDAVGLLRSAPDSPRHPIAQELIE